jgi:hypothetical protein
MLQQVAIRSEQAVALREATTAASDFARASKSAATRRAYQTDAADFTAWCKRHGLKPLPASVDTIAAYLASLASSGLKSSTITRRCAGIRYLHRMAGYDPPTSSEAIKAVLAGTLAWHGGYAKGTCHRRGYPHYAAGHARGPSWASRSGSFASRLFRSA